MKIHVLAAACIALGGSVAAAATSPLPTTLAGLVANGSTGITIGDKTFYDFAVQGDVAADAIQVVAPAGPDIGLEFKYNWSSTGGKNLDEVISYAVHVNDTTPTQQMITGVGLHFDGNATANSGGANTDLGTNANVTETISGKNGTNLGQITVFNAGSNFGSFDKNDATFLVTPPTRDLMVTKDIMVHSTTNSGSTSTISLVDNTFQQTTSTSSVPLPSAALMALTSLGLFGLLPIRRRLRAMA